MRKYNAVLRTDSNAKMAPFLFIQLGVAYYGSIFFHGLFMDFNVYNLLYFLCNDLSGDNLI
jgi:hypothetical protein